MTNYYLTKEKDNVESVFAVNGFGFAGRGQNTGIAFVSLKDWSQRPGEENKVEAITARAMGYFSQIKDAMVFAFNLPAIVELGTATGFDFELIDGRSGPRKLTQARNQLFGMVAQHPDVLTGVRLTVWKIHRSLKSISIRRKLRRWASPSATLTPRWAQLGGSYVNDFIDRGRVKKVYIMSKRNTVCCRKISASGMFAAAMVDGAVLCFLDLALGIRFAASGTLQRSAVTEILGQAAPVRVPVRRWR